jgi:hypothetical protein
LQIKIKDNGSVVKNLIKPFIVTSLIYLLSNIAHAEFVLGKPVVCDTSDKILSLVMGPEINEKPVWAGTTKDNENISTIIVFVNDKSSTWTILQIGEKYTCVIGVGDKFSLNSFETILKFSK